MQFAVERIRRLSSGDLGAANQVKQSATRRFGGGYSTRPVTKEVLVSRVQQDWARGLWIGNQLVGVCYGRSEGADLHIDFVGVLKEFEGHRFGVRLINELVKSAIEREMRRVTLVTSASAPWNMPYYKSLGFRCLKSDSLEEYLQSEVDFQTKQMREHSLLLPRIAMALELNSAAKETDR